MERMCENCKHFCVDNATAAMFCMGQKNMPRVRPFDTCDDWKPSYRTNGDAIRQMSDEELAALFAPTNTGLKPCPKGAKYPKSCEHGCGNCWLNWFKQEVEDEEEGF